MRWAEFREQISDILNSEELRTLCFDLNVDYDSLGGEGKDSKIRELIRLLKRNGRLPEFVGRMQEIRPNVDWAGQLTQIQTNDAILRNGKASTFVKKKRYIGLRYFIAGSIILGLIVLITVLVFTDRIDTNNLAVNTRNPTINDEIAIADNNNDEQIVSEGCLNEYFEGIGAERQVAVEVGEDSKDFIVATDDRESTELTAPYGMKLTRNGDIMGALKFSFHGEFSFLNIASMIDANCVPVEDYFDSRNKSKDSLQNNDHLEIRLNDSTFLLGINFRGELIRFNFQEN